ncbi:MAG: EAL domain-containing response regulator [Woeseia sp.]
MNWEEAFWTKFPKAGSGAQTEEPAMASREPRLLIVDDEPEICTFLEKAAGPLGFQVRTLSSPEAFVETLQSFRPIAVILDLVMPDCDGVELLRKMKDIDSDAHVIVISGVDQRMLSVAQNLGQSHGLKMLGVMQKPISLIALEEQLRKVIDVVKAFTARDLENALSRSELVVHFQPQVKCDSGIWTVDGAEALVRWNHPAFGLLLPGDFLSVAEESDLITPLTHFVLESSIRQVAEWRQRGLELGVSVNMSGRFLKDLDFPDRLKCLLGHYEVPGSQLTLELTESAAMTNPTQAMDIFLRLRMNDVKLAIDDFGTGYSSLKQLYQLPFDEMKIDRTFVSGLPDDKEAQTIVRATIGLAHALNLTICAEGVETQAALKYLAGLDCERAQGFLISPAVAADKIEPLCSKKWRSTGKARANVSRL